MFTWEKVLKPSTWGELNSNNSFYEAAFRQRIAYAWENTPFKDEAMTIAYHYAMQSMLQDNEIGERDRRTLLYHFLYPLFSSKNAQKTLNKMIGIMPSSNRYVKRALNNICMLYNKAPEIKVLFRDKEDEKAKEALNINSLNMALQSIYQLAKIHNEVLIRPFFEKEMIQYQYFTPDSYRVEYNEDGEPVRVWIWRQLYVSGSGFETQFWIWDKDKLELHDRAGKLLSFEVNGKSYTSFPNPYGVLPFQIRKLNTDLNDYIDSAGGTMWELVRAQIKYNMYDFLAHNQSVLQGFPIRWALNWYFDNKTNETDIGAGSILIKDDIRNPGEGDIIPPELSELGADVTWQTLRETALEEMKEELRDIGIPSSVINDTVGNISGTALKEERRELIEMRNKDKNACVYYDKELIKLTLKIAGSSLSSPVRFRNQFNVDYDISINYADMEVSAEFKEVQEKAEYLRTNGLVSPKEYLKMLTGVQVDTDEIAINLMTENKLMFNIQGDKDVGDKDVEGNRRGFDTVR